MSAIIFDTETTGIENAEVIELAFEEYIDLSDIFTQPLRTFHQLYQPRGDIQLGALATHHILPDDLDGQPTFSAASFTPPPYIIGHNVDFDWKVTGQPNVKRICTLALSRSLWPDLDSHTQGAIFYYLNGRTDETRSILRNAHSAVTDVYICRVILQHIVKALRVTNFEALWIASEDARIPTRMAFGKHKGELIADVPASYVAWYRRQDETDPYLLEAFRRARK